MIIVIVILIIIMNWLFDSNLDSELFDFGKKKQLISDLSVLKNSFTHLSLIESHRLIITLYKSP